MSDSTDSGPRNRADWFRPWMDWRRKRFWLLVGVSLYALFGYFGVPWLVERSIVNTFERAGRVATVDSVRFNPWIFRLEVHDVRVTDPDGLRVLTLGEQVGDFEARSLLLWAWTFSELRVSSLFLEEERFAGADTRLLRLIEALRGEPDPDAVETPDDGLPRLVIDLLTIEDTRLHFIDRTADDFETELGPIDVEVRDLRTLPDNQGRQQVSIQTAYGDRIEWQGSLGLGPLTSEGHLHLEGNSLHDTLSYLDHLMPFGMRLERIALDLDYRLQGGSGFEFEAQALDLDIEGLHARMDGEEEDIASLAAIQVHNAAFAWPMQSAEIEAVALRGLETDAILSPDGSLNLSRLLPPASEERAEPAPAARPWQVVLRHLELADARVGVADQSVTPAARLQLTGLGMVLTDLDLADGTRVPLTLRTELASGGEAGFEGHVVLVPEWSLDGRARISGFELKPLEAYALPYARIRLDSGRVDLDADVQVGPGDTMQVEGRLDLADLDVADTVKGERLAGWRHMVIDSFEADLAAGTVRTSEVVFREPFGRFHIAEDLSTNVSDLLVENPAQEAAEEAAPFQVSIGGLKFEQAALDFSDFSLPLPFATRILSLDGTVGALSTQSTQPADIKLEGQVNEFGLARIEGDVNAWDFTTHADIGMIFRNLDMSRLTPYTVQFAGYAIEGGRLDMDLRYLIENGQLKGDNSIVIKELDLGEKIEKPGAGSLPLKLAVALLTDPNGVIDIDLPVQGDMNDPSFKISGIVWRALGNLIAKAVTAPFRLLGALVGIESEDFGTLAFAAGRAELSPPDREQLLKLAEALGQRPELALTVTGVMAPGVDQPALQAQRLDQQLESRTRELAAAGQAGLDRKRLALESLFTEQFPGEDLEALAAVHTRPPATPDDTAELDEPAYLAALRERLLAAQTITDADLATLAQARADAVMAGLTASPDASPGNVQRGESIEVEADDSGTVPLELAVEAP